MKGRESKGGTSFEGFVMDYFSVGNERTVIHQMVGTNAGEPFYSTVGMSWAQEGSSGSGDTGSGFSGGRGHLLMLGAWFMVTCCSGGVGGIHSGTGGSGFSGAIGGRGTSNASEGLGGVSKSWSYQQWVSLLLSF